MAVFSIQAPQKTVKACCESIVIIDFLELLAEFFTLIERPVVALELRR